MEKDFELLYQEACKLSHKKYLTEVFRYGHTACAVLTEQGNIYTGISIKAVADLGFCAEYAAIEEMLKHGESTIVKLLAVRNGKIVSPCGRCRELLYQMGEVNQKMKIMVSENTVILLSDLLPYHWDYQEGRE